MDTQEDKAESLAINDPRAIERVLDMHDIAVVGLSSEPMRDSYRVSQYMANEGYEITPVNPTISTSLNRRSYPTLAAIGRPIEVVNVFRRPQYVADIVDQAIAIGAKAIWLQYGVVAVAAAEKARKAGLLVVMDRCIKVEHMRLKLRAERGERQKRTNA